MVIIDDVLVESAIAIKKEFNELRAKLSIYEKHVLDLSTYLLEVSNELESYAKKDIKKAANVSESTQFIIKKMVEMEEESNRVTSLIDPINIAIESLKKDEMTLYQLIKEKNTNSSDVDIIKALNEKMKKSDT